MKHEEWREVKQFEGLYQISNKGNLRSLERAVYHTGNGCNHHIEGRKLTTRINNKGYASVRLNKNGQTFTRFVHRLMAEAFIPNPHNKKYINHKNGIKTDNFLDNLEWCTMSENILHAYRLGLIKRKRIIISIENKIKMKALYVSNS